MDRRRIRELSEREAARLRDRTPASEAMFRRAGRSLALVVGLRTGGVVPMTPP